MNERPLAGTYFPVGPAGKAKSICIVVPPAKAAAWPLPQLPHTSDQMAACPAANDSDPLVMQQAALPEEIVASFLAHERHLQMCVRVDAARQDVLPSCIDYTSPRRNLTCQNECKATENQRAAHPARDTICAPPNQSQQQ